MEFDKLHWIRTRDGSPTLWHNDEGAAFRSQKGAFTESLCAFVRPALEHALQLSAQEPTAPQQLRVVEFGLGPGTNWALWTLSETALLKAERLRNHSPASYTAIERDTESFALGNAAWIENIELLTRFVSAEWDIELTQDEALKSLECARSRLEIVPSLDAWVTRASDTHSQTTLWFHDPFGYDINPSAYQTEELSKLRPCLGPKSRGFSYACNVAFQKALRASGFKVATPETAHVGLKRERLEFWPSST